ncbi:hypothetical protein MAPG_02860 [Magnaporthiopsis poae ATCC 64411]|uniref:Autophagy-related protein 33 n=1 Tax=Magnaporthiopsis poae (strain ATCC 64411 / 73-15) TaxID=644358 RepID=A0A0C4DSH9_MAGP6|nr:hypothetical protein MAPG_02860 [Magnaporthiopsis poae ATCC 64411]
MAFRGVSLLKFVGTVSLGLLTGLSYTLSSLTAPALLTLPSASAASRGFRTLASTARTRLRALTIASSACFALAFLASPRYGRHPYLLYTSLLTGLSGAVVSDDLLAPYLGLATPPRRARPASTSTAAAAAARRERAARARMEASYEVLGGSDSAHSDEGDDDDDTVDDDTTVVASAADEVNGEEVRGDVDNFIKKQVVRASVAGFGFLVAVLGIWGDGAVRPTVYRY